MRRAAWTSASIVLLGAFAYFLLIDIPQRATATEALPLTTSPADVGLAYEDFTVRPADRDIAIAGWWMPAARPRASLVFIHGAGSHRHSRFFGSLAFYEALVAAGVNVAAIDLRNHGVSDSDGVGLQFGRTEKYDALAAINWVRRRAPQLPLFAMGISMGGATVIQAAGHLQTTGDQQATGLAGLILLDSLLDTVDTFSHGGWVDTGLPAALFLPSAWSATRFFGLPGGAQQPLEVAAQLKLPILALQDPDDPVTRAPFARELARRNPDVALWLAPPTPPDHPEIAWRGRWGSHVAAFVVHPEATLARILAFIDARTASLNRHAAVALPVD